MPPTKTVNDGKIAHNPTDAEARPVCEPQAVPYTLFTSGERWGIVVLVALAGWFSTLSSFIFYPAISAIAADLHTSIALVNLTVTSYMLVSPALHTAVVSDASDTFGRRPLYAVTLTLYVVANVGIARQRSFVALLLLRMLQSAGISGKPPPTNQSSELGAALASTAGWRWIFWFLAIASGSCLVGIALMLPETNRALVSNGGHPPPKLSRPILVGLMRPCKPSRGPPDPIRPRKAHFPNPVKSLRVLSRKDVAVSIIPGSILYMVYSCVNTSLSTRFISSYHLNHIGAVLSTAVSGAHGLPIDKEARMRSVFIPTLLASAAVVTYGWLVDKMVVTREDQPLDLCFSNTLEELLTLFIILRAFILL
ncbi:major facilitator superfamily domain-containing protein [Hypoxylon argillaceum]|nr:major facilitator superfamily domain-containing protein [Hypoxylon argillaceum]